MNRFAALVAALLLCASLCVPVFASNNASTRKWRVIASEQRVGENGSLTTYFKLSPYENGALYQVPLYTRFGAASKSISGSTVYDVWAEPVNYPDWWRSDIPLGSRSYVEISNIQGLSYRFNGSSSQTSFVILPVHRDTLMRFSFSAYSSASSFSGGLSVVPVLFYRYFGSTPDVVSVSGFGYNFEKTDVNDSSFSVIGALETRRNLVYTPIDLSFSGTTDFDVGLSSPFYNCSSSDLIWIILPKELHASSPSAMLGSFASVRCTISLSANVTTIAAAGGNATLSTSATRSRTWQWNGTGTTYTENASGSPTLSKVNGAASLSGSTVSYGNNTSTSSRSSVFRATIDSITKDITISQSAGSKSYGSWSNWSVYCNASSYTVAASGGSVTINYGASRSRNWNWNGVAGSGGTETENATPSLSVGSGGGTLSGSTLSYSNNTSTSVRRTRVTANYNGAIDFCDIEQRAGSKVYGNWSGWSVSISASPTNIAAAGGSSTITCSAVRSRQYTWNGIGQNFPETENGSPTLSKSGDGTLSGTTSGSKLTYGNRTTTTSRSTTVTATYSGVSKSINITQSAGAKVYGAKVYHTKYYGTNPDGSGLDFTGYPYTNEIDTVADANTISVSVYYRLYTAQPWTWNGVAGSGGTETVYYNPDDVNVTNKVNCDVSVANAFNYASMIIITFKLSANNSDTAREYKIEWNWLNHNVITKGTQRANPMRGRLVIKNDYFTSQNVALPIYLDSENVDSIYKGEASYNDIKKTPIGVYVYIPTNISIMNAGKLQFWFENKDGGGSKYTCTLSSVSTPLNNASVSNSNNIISVTANTTTSSFTILCQFTMTSNSTVFNVRVLIEP